MNSQAKSTYRPSRDEASKGRTWKSSSETGRAWPGRNNDGMGRKIGPTHSFVNLIQINLLHPLDYAALVFPLKMRMVEHGRIKQVLNYVQKNYLAICELIVLTAGSNR